MVTITNNKIAEFEPIRWAPYRGFSLLFDNPGKNLSSMGEGWLNIDCDLGGSKYLKFYEGLVAFLDKMVRKHRLTNTYLFCPLPSSSYHVTVWDGLNDGNVQGVSASYRLKLKDFLDALPDSLLTDKIFTSQVYHSPLVTNTNRPIAFRFQKLANWSNNQVLVARLVPADQDSEREFERIVDDREVLSTKFLGRFGIKMRRHYNPHVTLGYFANEEYGELATSQIPSWTKSFEKKVGHLTISFSSISLYGFTDMVTFFKSRQPPFRAAIPA